MDIWWIAGYVFSGIYGGLFRMLFSSGKPIQSDDGGKINGALGGYRGNSRARRKNTHKSPTRVRKKRKKAEVQDKYHGSALNFSPPSPPRMIAFMNEKNRSPYSLGGTGLILC